MQPTRALLALLAALCASLVFSSAGSAGVVLTRPEARLLEVMNEARQAYGLRPLRIDPRLLRAARWQSSNMAAHGYFSHGAFGSRMAQFGIRGRYLGENLAFGSGGGGAARSVVRAWLASPPHRLNLLRPGFRRVGIGAAIGASGSLSGARLVTADFAGS